MTTTQVNSYGQPHQVGSVLQDWVMDLPIREQGTLLTGTRGCDLAPKPFDAEAVESTERRLTAYLRYCILNAADVREVDVPGAFFQSRPPYAHEWRPSELGHYPLHWYSHLMHCFEIVGYRHPDGVIRLDCHEIYVRLVHGLHLNPETKEQMIERLSEDRIANGEVVS